MAANQLIKSIIRALMFLGGTLGNNWLAICSLHGQKSGIRTNEVLFINLAVSNLITNYLVDLPDTMADLAGRWFLGETLCFVFRFCSDLSETSSIYTTLLICAFWHQKLVGSLKRGGAPAQLDSLCLVGCLLAGSWTLAVVFSIPHFFFVAVESTNESHEHCEDIFPNGIARKTFDIFYLTFANALPVAGILFTSVQIVISLLQNLQRIHGHTSDPTEEKVKDERKSIENRNVSTVSCPGTSKNPKDSAFLTHIYTDMPASSCPNGGLCHSSPLNRVTNTESRVGPPPNLPRPSQTPAKPSPSSNTQVRAAKSVLAVASVFLFCWLTHLVVRITNTIHTSSIAMEMASYIGAAYTCIIPYIFLFGMKRISCSWKR
ncbi:tyramine receptor Ser-2 [Sander lucioperca]|uniref:tyramine receptor Ser-2 n=1 Tax=Sander lucioperca TaxID=283035 RepID=UPI00125D3C5C|nr:tyramine receptor Ser-2 [Sander lucioperca]